MIFPNLTPVAINLKNTDAHYSRFERRNSAFVIQNNTNGLFVSRTIENKKVIYKDVPLDKATGFKYISLDAIITDMLQLNPTLDLSVKLAYRDPKTRKICVK